MIHLSFDTCTFCNTVPARNSKAKKLNPNSAASRRLKASQSVDSKASSSWEHDRIPSFGSNEDHQRVTGLENFFSVNPFDSDDLRIRKNMKDNDISFGNFEPPSVSTVWNNSIESNNVTKDDHPSSHRKSPSKSFESTKPIPLDPTNSLDPCIGIEVSISKRDSRENLPSVASPADSDIEYMMRETSLLDDIKINPFEVTEKQEKKKRFSFRRIDSNSVNS